MLDQKKWYMSKTVWGVVVMLLSSTLATVGIQIDAAAQGEVVDLIMHGITVAGAALAVYGRITAKAEIE